VLALRGPQTVGELRTRTERMHDFASLSEVEEVLDGLADRDEPLVMRLERQPGQKETRFAQLLGGPVDAAAWAAPAAPGASGASGGEGGFDRPASAGAGPTRTDRVAALEARVESLEAELAILRAEHRELREELGLGAPPARPAPDGPEEGSPEEGSPEEKSPEE